MYTVLLFCCTNSDPVSAVELTDTGDMVLAFFEPFPAWVGGGGAGGKFMISDMEASMRSGGWLLPRKQLSSIPTGSECVDHTGFMQNRKKNKDDSKSRVSGYWIKDITKLPSKTNII